MFRILLHGALPALGLAGGQVAPGWAQAIPGRSADYLFASNVSDVRAAWVNPAGLAAVPEASIMGEMSLAQELNDWRLAQYAVGLNSRGFSLTYQKDRLTGTLSGNSNTTIRLGTALPLRRAAIGVAVAFHNAGVTNRGLDIGARWSIIRPLNLGAVLRNIGRPRVRAGNTPLIGIGSASLDVRPGMLALLAEARATERRPLSGWDMSYHAGARVSFGRRVPVSALGLVDLTDRLRVDRWSVGMAIGGLYQGLVLGTIDPGATPALRQASLTGITRRPIVGRPGRDEF